MSPATRIKKGNFCLISPDKRFSSALLEKVSAFGGNVVGDASPDCEAAVILVDVRSDIEEVLNRLKTTKSMLRVAEIVLINRTGNVTGSLAGMRAGATDELIVPLDLGHLRTTLNHAWRRCRRQLSRSRRSCLRDFLERSMSAAAFAHVGEFETARNMLNGPGETSQDTDKQ